jgi:hypothetical protein
MPVRASKPTREDDSITQEIFQNGQHQSVAEQRFGYGHGNIAV